MKRRRRDEEGHFEDGQLPGVYQGRGTAAAGAAQEEEEDDYLKYGKEGATTESCSKMAGRL
ncbi:hypothetical protein RUM43_000551 [Polyplax serrata]|uniref:Uncharacterized protein n=1 Tax=Polyplax serrata TaxID=468196 RepID=A0AAN8SE44_POLSC